MRVAMIGTGYVGLVSGVCFSDFGHDVSLRRQGRGQDRTPEARRSPIYEPGLEALMAKNVEAGRLSSPPTSKARSRCRRGVHRRRHADPPRRRPRRPDLCIYAAEEIADGADRGHDRGRVKSTVPVGTNREVCASARRATRSRVDVASNPEFLREGAAIEDFMRPDRVVVGTPRATARETPDARSTARCRCARRRSCSPARERRTDQVRRQRLPRDQDHLHQRDGGPLRARRRDVQDVIAKGIGLDGRIGRSSSIPGPGYGGSCFPKDTLALTKTRGDGAPVRIVETVVEVNEARKRAWRRKIIEAMGGDVSRQDASRCSG
jgi:UDPglucose 6-dehydrogenase